MHRFRLNLVDGLGNDSLFDFELPYDIDYCGFLRRVKWRFGTQPCFEIHDETNYANWGERLGLLSFRNIDKSAVADAETLIEEYKNIDFEQLGEWTWWQDGSHYRIIHSDDVFTALMAAAKAGQLNRQGCFMRYSEAKFREVTTKLKVLEKQEADAFWGPRFSQFERDQEIQAQETAVGAAAGAGDDDDSAAGGGAPGGANENRNNGDKPKEPLRPDSRD